MSLAQIPLRLTAGAFVLNSGLGKRNLPDEAAEGMRDMAANGIPALADLSPAQFRTFITVSEVGIGGMLLAPFVPGWLAGSALSAFSAGLLSMYARTPGMTQDDGVRPTEDGTAVAKDVIMAGSGLGIMLDDLVNSSGRKRKRASRRAAKIQRAKQSKVEAIDEARKQYNADRKEARAKQAELIKQAAKKTTKTAKQAAAAFTK